VDFSDIPFAISEIPSKLNDLSIRLDEIAVVIGPDPTIISNDVYARQYTLLLEDEKDAIMENIGTMGFRRLERLIRAWQNYSVAFNKDMDRINARSDLLNTIRTEVTGYSSDWMAINAFVQASDISAISRNRGDSAASVLRETLSIIDLRKDSLNTKQRRLASLIITINDVIRVLEEEQNAVSSNYFILDAKPIWQRADSTSIPISGREHLRAEWNEVTKVFHTYFLANSGTMLSQIIFILLLMIGFILLNRHWKTENLDPQSKREQQAKFIISRPFFSALMVGIIISYYFLSNPPLLLGDIFVLVLLISSMVLLPVLFTRKIRPFLLAIWVLYLVDLIKFLLPYHSLLGRLLILAESLALLYMFIRVYRMHDDFGMAKRGVQIFKGLVRVFGLLIIVALGANIIGSIRLSTFLVTSTIQTSAISIVIINIVIILNSLTILFIKGRHSHSIPMYHQVKQLIDRYIRPIIAWGGFLLWLMIALRSFRIFKPLKNWFGNLLSLKLEFGSVSISISGIFSFIIVILVTYLLVRFINRIFKDEWVTNSKLPRGTAEAISMIARYIIVAFGIYLALVSAGINLNKFGFIAGALGVGIGFGLQNVVLNFIAGLILSVERPIHIGDVVEVDQDMGRVTEIGVRASKILTWDGSEVIVPNGVLISNRVVNWTLTDEKRRLVIPIRTSFDPDPNDVVEILTEVMKSHPNVDQGIEPFTMFNGYGESSFDFTMYCWVEFGVGFRTKGDIALQAHNALIKKGITVPVPLRKIQHEKGNE
jgi:small-conductance mechanosensitive channel